MAVALPRGHDAGRGGVTRDQAARSRLLAEVAAVGVLAILLVRGVGAVFIVVAPVPGGGERFNI